MNIEISKVEVVKPFSATRLANETYSESEVQTIPVGTKLDVDISSAVAPGKIKFNAGGDRFESTIEDIDRSTKVI